MDSKILTNKKFFRIINMDEIFHKYHSYLWIMPLSISIMIIITLPLTYMMAVFIGDRYSISLVSDVATAAPFSDEEIIAKLSWQNYRYFICMILVAIGLTFVGNFPCNYHPFPHAFGVVLILFSLIAFYDQIYICQKLYEFNRIESQPISMTIISCLIIIGWFIAIATGLIASFQQESKILTLMNNDLRMKWTDEQPGSQWFKITVLAEWITFLLYSPIYLMLTNRMKQFHNWQKIFTN
ncbi:hypothetical protein DERP_014561 [Dermatophagoides pteronyssinus]|uniref:Uncharacterized protein n=1 Tax=Dermatophagoides pteronyssinus TaxID=6956 RepID=A0ABQ8IQ40_DERPT|nr:hypothetical protein DERP_014561 [Dermatophagoides pteronyssinus]